jgi:hypothetical protein
MLLFTALAAGAYPALYVSSYNPVSIFRGKQRLGGRRGIIRFLLTLQFALSMIGIISSLIMNRNAEFIENFNLGFAKEHIAVVRVRGDSQYDIFKSTIISSPEITAVGASRNRVGWSWFTSDIEVDSKAARVKRLEVGENYLQTVGLDLIAGREFDEQLQTDLSEAVIVNETFARQFGWTDPLDKHFKMNDQEYRVIGVIRDFYENGVWRKVSPVFLKYADPERINYASVKFQAGSVKETLTFLESSWKQLFPSLPSNIRFQEEVMAEALQVTDSIRTVSFYISILAILISATGLFALVSLTIAKRTKEIGIRKVLGASLTNIVRLVSKEFTLLLVIATLVAAAAGYFMMDSLLKSIYAYYVSFGVSPFTAASIVVIMVSLLTVASQVYRVGIANPVRALRDE